MSELHNRARLNGIKPRIAQPKPLAIANQLRPMSLSPSEISNSNYFTLVGSLVFEVAVGIDFCRGRARP